MYNIIPLSLVHDSVYLISIIRSIVMINYVFIQNFISNYSSIHK